MALVMEDEMENLVKPDKKNEWKMAAKQWFVQDHEDAWDLRKPGKMKLEWSTEDGGFIAYVKYFIKLALEIPLKFHKTL